MDMEIDKYINYCTVEQTNRAIKLGCPCDNPEDHNPVITPSTQAMIGWLREKGIYMDIHPTTDGSNYNWYFEMLFDFIHDKEEWHCDNSHVFNTYKKSELVAIDEALDYLETYEKR